jgi:hypothetical protein
LSIKVKHHKIKHKSKTLPTFGEVLLLIQFFGMIFDPAFKKSSVVDMKKTNWYTRFMSVWLAVWLLVLATGGQALSAHKPSAKQETAKNANKPAPAQETPSIQALALEAVVSPALSFDFTQEFYFLPNVFSFEHKTVMLPRCFAIFYFYFSFFRHVFGTYIAINAP